MILHFELCPSPLLYTTYAQKMISPTVIVVDVLRASTTIIEALTNGASRMIIVASEQEAQLYAERGYLVGAERNACRCPFARLGNDPAEYTKAIVSGQEIVFSTTNGTQSISTACLNGASEVLIGSYVNLPSIAQYLIDQSREEVIVLAAGWQGTVSIEDCLFAGALSTTLQAAGVSIETGDAAQMAADLWMLHGQSITSFSAYITQSEHFKRLEELELTESVAQCITPVDGSIVPVVREENGLWIATAHRSLQP